MDRRITVRPAADLDIAEQSLFLTNLSLDLGIRFLDAVRAALERIASMPHIGAPFSIANHPLVRLRFWPVPGFPHLIYYVVTREGVDVIRVLHGAQDRDEILGTEHPGEV